MKVLKFCEFINESRLDNKLIKYTETTKKLFASFQKSNKQTREMKKLISEFYELDIKIKKFTKEQEPLKAEVKKLGTDFFDVGDEFMTRVIQLEEFAVTFSAESESKKVNYEKLFKAIYEKLTPKLKKIADELIEECTTTVRTVSKLSSVKKDTVDEGIADIIQKWKENLKDLISQVADWFSDYDDEFEQIQKMV